MSDISSGHSQSDSARDGQPLPFFCQLTSYRRTNTKLRKKTKGNLDRMTPTPYTKVVKVHPLAGKCGEGPPLAPEHWKWRAGNRLNDMYFTSPTGEKFRSRPELAIYLATLDNPPPPDSFQWRVTEEFLANNQVAASDARSPQRRQGGEGSSKRQSGEGSAKKQNGEGSFKKKAEKRKDDSKDTEEKEKKKVKTEPPVTPTQSSPTEKVPLLPISEPVPEPTPERGTDGTVGALYTTPVARPRPKMKATKKEKYDKDWGDRSFANVLASKASCKWLYDNEAAARFLAEAEKLKEKSDSELAYLRNILLNRSSDMSNISRYSNQVLRVFVQILRNVQPPSTMGKVELADLVVNWKCKRKHPWCSLETSRLAPPPDPKPSKVDSLSSGSKEEKATDASIRGSIPVPQEMTNSGSTSAQGELMSRSSRRSKEGVQLEVSLGNIHNTLSKAQTSQSPLDLNVKVPSAAEEYSRRLLAAKLEPGPHNQKGNTGASNPNASMFQAGAEVHQSGGMTSSPYGHTHVNRGSGTMEATADLQNVVMGSESVYNVQYKMSESVVILDRVATTSRRGLPAANQQEEETVCLPRTENMGSSSCANVAKDVEHTQLAPSTPLSYQFDRESSVCWCKFCSADQSFCRGCMCCLCPNPVKLEDDWMALKCECKHMCHVKCALEKNLAGVVRDLNLDGELSCPVCSQKLDLRPFFEKSFDRLHDADTKMHPTDLGPLAVLVLQLLKGTQNKKYTYFLKLVAELYDIMKQFPIQNLVRLLLSEIKDELNDPLSPESGAPHVGEEAMSGAIRKRAEMEPLFCTLESAYQGAIAHTKEARAAQAYDKAKRKDLELSHVEVSPASILEQIEIQKKKAQQEFEKLGRLKSTMVKPETGSFADIDSSMNKWLESVRVQRKAVEAAETELHRLQNQYKHAIGMY